MASQTCAESCVFQYFAHPQGAVVDPGLGSGCLAYRILACAVENGCGPACAPPDAAPPPYDAGVDADADAGGPADAAND